MAVFGRVSGTGRCVACPLRCRTATERGNGDMLRGILVVTLLHVKGGSASAGRRRGPRRGISVYMDLEASIGARPRPSVRPFGPSDLPRV